ncbi:hypothetical protein GCM10009530_18880 [Microbispora corallina]|uniref:CBM2 domain-containing protein n=1 Tax=Microbispora corallina TaxID=83302 RepID=A0ABQ4FUG7_9ACTN|nr:cellulose binding domain-containing protein [Microbispora corallina]GIH38453.1 hypothetical protein Mco01_14530 [Microbispora corallina]
MTRTSTAAVLLAGVLGALGVPAVPATADSIGCAADYQITSVWSGWSGAGDANALGQVTVRNTGSSPLTGWRVTWRYTDGTTITQVWGAVPLPVVGPVGSAAFGNETYNGNLPIGGSTVFGFAARRPANAVDPRPVTCTPA